jgi:hypothetical protein
MASVRDAKLLRLPRIPKKQTTISESDFDILRAAPDDWPKHIEFSWIF